MNGAQHLLPKKNKSGEEVFMAKKEILPTFLVIMLIW